MISVLSSGDSLAIAILVPLAVSFLVAVGCGFGARALMRNKGRSGARGFCLGFFMGVIGVLIAALLSPTPEFEAVKMRRQMALMGISMPSGAVPGDAAPAAFYSNGTMLPPMHLAATGTSIPNRPSAIVAFVVACGYSLLWVAFRIDRTVFGDTEEITLVVFIVAVVLCILALAKPGNPIVGAAAGTTLAMSGTGIFFVSYAVFGHQLLTSSALGSLVLDLLALAAAAMLVFSDRNRGDRETQTSGLQNVAMALAALGAVCALASANVYDAPWFVSRLPFTIGFGLVAFGMTRRSRVLLLFDLVWCATTAFGVLSSKFQWFRHDGADAFGVVTLLCLIALAGIAAVLYVQQPVTINAPRVTESTLSSSAWPGSRQPPRTGPTQTEPVAAPQWAADPFGRHQHRYFDGRVWTDQVANGGVASADPAVTTPAPLYHSPAAPRVPASEPADAWWTPSVENPASWSPPATGWDHRQQ